MKLIIEIPDHEYKYTCERTLSDRTFWDDAIRNGTPLDDVKTEIKTEYDRIPWRNSNYDDGRLDALRWVLTTLGNIGKAESEDT